MAGRSEPIGVTDPVDLPWYREQIESVVTPELSGLQSFCLFVGYPRSGHSLVGSLLDAHPQALIAHELDVLALWERGADHQEIAKFIHWNSREMARNGRRQSGYSYPLQGQGQSLSPLVLGDKKGGRTAHYLLSNPSILQEFQDFLPWPLRLIHVVRDPRDTIATMSRLHDVSIESAMTSFLNRAEAILELKKTWPGERIHELHLEKLIARPTARLKKLCSYLGLAPEPRHTRDCCQLIFGESKQTRQDVSWGAHAQTLTKRSRTIPFLTSYFEGD